MIFFFYAVFTSYSLRTSIYVLPLLECLICMFRFKNQRLIALVDKIILEKMITLLKLWSINIGPKKKYWITINNYFMLILCAFFLLLLFKINLKNSIVIIAPKHINMQVFFVFFDHLLLWKLKFGFSATAKIRNRIITKI